MLSDSDGADPEKERAMETMAGYLGMQKPRALMALIDWHGRNAYYKNGNGVHSTRWHGLDFKTQIAESFAIVDDFMRFDREHPSK